MEVLLKLDNFEGPLDLLLNLIDKKKMKISEISISQLIDEYLEVLRLSEREDIEIKAEFIITASELLEIKTLNLLNLDKDKEKEKELKRKLEEYKLFKEISPKISALENEFNISYSRGEARREIKKISREYDLSFLTTEDIYRAYVKHYEETQFSDVLELNLNKQYDIKDVMDDILIKVYFENRVMDSLFKSAENRLHLIYIFLAILELYKDGKISIFNGEIRKC
ncbi:MAG: ScpA family protein [Fusobacterium sp.]|uniref:segregation and condensation protein A n=1 Tax=Fusobacterium sp. TaxID=68766 RepID=UPI0026DD8229|nr:ScpA family protein [Fusobacterium sp.]MDO4690740.1 ScpA family protein [Fusobacterium sp.]